MSRLFLATERSLNRQVVIKLLPRELTSEVSAARFQREIELAAQLQHPHILPVHAAGTKDDLLYYVMPYVPGESLRLRLAREGPLPVADAVRILHEVADALAYAHRAGVVHRDVKPENILLEQGHAVLADFGVARALAEADRAVGGRLTRTGTAVGTPGYMAPEQVAGEDSIDARADVYALGVVGYEMLAGTPPFGGRTAQEVLTAHLTRTPVALTDVRHDTPASVSRAIHKALAKSAGERFATAAEFRDALAASGAAGGEALQPEPVRPRSFSAAGFRSLVSGARRALQHLWPRQPVPISSSTIAVLPFSVRGSEKLAYLGEGMVDLLSTKLDGAGDLSAADPRAILGIVGQLEQRTLDPERGRHIAERLGAGLYILGNLLEVGGRLQLTASLYDAQGMLRTTAQAAANDEAQIFELVDELAIQLLVGRTEGGPHVTHLASTTTHRLPALRAYLEGERQFRSGQFALAKEAFQRAVDADPLFALAWYRLSVAAEWVQDRELQDYAAEQALQHSVRLPEYDRQLLEAFVAWRRGSPTAEGLYRSIVRSKPNEVEAWFQLGEVLYHYGPLSGRSTAESREAWERVLVFEPDHLGALYHLARIASVGGRRDELDALRDRFVELAPTTEWTLEVLALRAFGLGDAAEQQRILDELQQASDSTLLAAIRAVAMFGGGPAGALPIARLATESTRPAEIRVLGHVQRAYLEQARGRRSAAQSELTAAARFDGASAIAARGLLAVLPFMTISRSECEAVRDALAAWGAAAVPPSHSPSMFARIHNGVHAHLRAYLLGLLSVRLGDEEEAQRHAAELAELGTSPRERAFAHALSQGVQAEIAWACRNTEATLAALERMTLEVGYDASLASPFYSRSLQRFLHATLLAEQGPLEEAIRLYGSFAEVSLYDLIFLAPSHLKRGEIHERLGNRDRAMEHYARFTELWSECDGELRPVVAEAEQRLARLRAASVPS